MDDEQILNRGGTERDISEYAKQNGAALQPGPWNDPNVRWVCEDHPNEDQGHVLGWWPFRRECGGAGMPKERCFFTDHEPVWCGDSYICLHCYLPFIPKR